MGKELLTTIVGAVIILLVAQFINSAMEISSFEETYREALISNYEILGHSSQSQIERDIANSKPLYLNNRLSEYAESLMRIDPFIREVMVTGPEQEIFYHSQPEMIGRIISAPELFPPFNKEDSDKSLSELKNQYYIGLPLKEPGGAVAGGLYLAFDKQVLKEKTSQIIRTHMRFFLAILSVTLLVMSVLLLITNSLFRGRGRSALFRRRFFTIIIALSVVMSQMVFALLNQTYFRDTYRSVFTENARTLAEDIDRDIENILQWDIGIDEMLGAEQLLQERLSDSREASQIFITRDSGKPVYMAVKDKDGDVLAAGINAGSHFLLPEDPIPLQEGPGRISVSLQGSSSRSFGHLIVEINNSFISKHLQDMLLDTLTIILVSFIFSLELLRLLSLFVSKDVVLEDQEKKRMRLNRIRLTAFLFFFAALIPLSFLPIFIEKVYEMNPKNLSFWKGESLLSLPISSYMIGITIFIPIVGSLARRLSQRRIFFLSGALFIAGTLWTAFSTSMAELILARFIAGLGYGGGIINSTTLIINSTSAGNRSQGFGNWSAGFAAASICAISVGGVVVYRLGYTVAFLMSAAFGALTLLFIFLHHEKEEKHQADPEEPLIRDTGSFKDLLSIFRNKSLAANLIFTSVPFQLAYVGLFQYIFPLYMNDIGITTSNIGRILMIYGLISLLTPMVSALSDKTKAIRPFIVAGNIIMGSFLLVLFFSSSFWALLAAILFMGLGSMIVDAVNEAYITGTKEAKTLGPTKLLSLYLTYEKIISIIVPVTAGVMIATFNYQKTIGIIGAFTIIGTLLFALISRKNDIQENSEGAPHAAE